MELDKLDLEDLPQQLELFASDLSTFLYSLNEFPEFTDKAVDAPIIAFEDDLKVSAILLLRISNFVNSFLVLGLMFDSIRRCVIFTLRRRDAYVHGHKGKLKSLAVRRYLHELMADVGEHLNSLSTALSMFIEVGWSPNLHARGVGNQN